MFSKLDQTLDNVFIPYCNPKENKIAKFKPDFIFWIQTDKKFIILFIDPKASTYTDVNYKIDGYKTIFMKDNKPKVFNNKLVYLQMWGNNNTGKEYEEFRTNNFSNLAKIILNNDL